jgi:hypothetical protein
MKMYTLSFMAPDIEYLISSIELRAASIVTGIRLQVESQDARPEDPHMEDPFKDVQPAVKPQEVKWGYKKDGTPRRRPGRKVRS